MIMHRLFAVTLAVVAASWAVGSTVSAQDSTDKSNWSNVQAIAPDTRVYVRGLTKKDNADGRVVTVDGDSLTIATKNGNKVLGRSDLKEVETINPHRTRWYVVGISAMVAAAVAITFATQESTTLCNGGYTCASFPADPSAGVQALRFGVILGAGAPFLFLGRSVKVYESH
jgi:hypothetical protein